MVVQVYIVAHQSFTPSANLGKRFMSKSSGISIISAEFNRELIHAMLAIAKSEMETLGLPIANELFVPGAFEVPLVAEVEISKPGIQGLIVLGHIERGETLHGEVMGHVVYSSLIDMQLQWKKPIGLGIIGPGATPDQAKLRYEASAKAAVRAVKTVLDILRVKS